MANVKIGLDQTNNPSPLWYRKMMNAIILSFLPAYVGIVQGVAMSSDTRNIHMVIAAAIPFILKGIAMIIGNGQRYEPSNEQIENVPEGGFDNPGGPPPIPVNPPPKP